MTRLQIPGTELTVAPLCFGQGGIGVDTTEAEAAYLLDMFADMGGNFLDTARVYSDWVPGETGRSERILGDYLSVSERRKRFAVCTKGGHGPLHAAGLDLASARRDLDASLQALRCECIDVYCLHRDNENLPVEEIFAMLDEMKRAGKIRCMGISNWKLDRWEKIHALAGGAIVNQIGWSIATAAARPHTDPTLVDMDAETLEFHRASGAFTMAYHAQARGYFVKALNGNFDPNDRLDTPENRHLAICLQEIATKTAASVMELVFAFLLQQQFPVAPIFSTKSPERLREIMESRMANFDLSQMLCP